jgi:hypothetical protein
MTAVTPDVDLGKFEGKRVIGAAMTITNTGDGLSDAMELDPMKLHHGDEVVMVVRGTVVDVRHPAAKEGKGVVRKHVVKASEAIVVQGDLVDDLDKMLNESAARLSEKRMAEVGQDPLGEVVSINKPGDDALAE